MRKIKLLAGALALILSGCASSDLGGLGNVLNSSPVNYASGSILGTKLPEKDQRDLQPVFTQAITNGANGERYDWQGPASFGWVKAKENLLGNLRPNEADRLPYPKGLDLSFNLETEKGLYVLTRNANVRLGPSTDYGVITQLESGTGLDIIGQVENGEWMLAAVNDRIVGYIFAGLMIKAPGTELELAGGPTRKPVACRSFEQRISFQGRSDRWNGVACFEGDEWVLTARPANEPVLLN